MTAPQTSTNDEIPEEGLKGGSDGAETFSQSEADAPTDDLSEDLKKTFGGSVAAQDEASLSLVVLRDVAIVSALLSLFAAAEAWATVSGLAFAALLSTVNGFLVGAATNALGHEWGHFAGARLGGGHAPLKPIGGFLPLFDFDYASNDKRAFDWMSIGGNAVHFGVPILYFVALPMNSPGTAALVAGAAGFAVFSGIIEIPVIRKSLAGMGSLESLGTIPRDFVQRTLPWALGSAFLIFLVL
jgi:hypothetical protein